MAKNFELKGVGFTLQFGNAGPKLRTSGDDFEARNATNSDFVNVSVKDAINLDHAVTKGQLDTYASEVLYREKATFDFNDSGVINVGDSIPANSVVVKVIINVDTAFDGQNATFTLGVSGNESALHTVNSNNLQAAGIYTTEEYFDIGSSAAQIIGTLVNDSSSTGSATVVFLYYKS